MEFTPSEQRGTPRGLAHTHRFSSLASAASARSCIPVNAPDGRERLPSHLRDTEGSVGSRPPGIAVAWPGSCQRGEGESSMAKLTKAEIKRALLAVRDHRAARDGRSSDATLMRSLLASERAMNKLQADWMRKSGFDKRS